MTSTITALMQVRNEDWILGLSARVALAWCDQIFFLDHASTDRTPAIIAGLKEKFPGRIASLRDERAEWVEMGMRDAMLRGAREAYPATTHWALVDADEVLTANLTDQVRARAAAVGPGEQLDIPMVAIWRDLDHYRADGAVWCRSAITTLVGEAPALSWAPRSDGYQHHSRAPRGVTKAHALTFPSVAMGGVMHLQWASWRRVVAKHVWYRMMEVLRWPGRTSPADLNRTYNAALEDALRRRPCPPEWWQRWAIWRTFVDLDRVPWHEAEIARMLAEHGRERFRGLELKGYDRRPR